jgi:predicted transcriptional regulator
MRRRRRRRATVKTVESDLVSKNWCFRSRSTRANRVRSIKLYSRRAATQFAAGIAGHLDCSFRRPAAP